ncbi:hypothetical protein D9757_005387 [Collybiopsis confluens]|uniref:AB hydrolase-1 domain-containing protein n=1 Tax=Collybiopsis confluens TaxID=2823264 RepID=A0A8H5HKX7_9AGAR|nr:hypothetical protein D9757_005387 [Collybiopsis confluens]
MEREDLSPLSPLTVPVLGDREGRATFSTAPPSRSHTPFQKRSRSPAPSESEFEFNPSSNASIRRAIISYENLVALADAQERLKYVLANRKETLKEARKMVWRDKGEPVVELADVEECLRWALKGGFRAAGLALNIRAAFNIVLALIKLPSVPKKHWVNLIQRAIFGLDTFRFAAMLGSFVSIYKFLLNALPFLIPSVRVTKRDFPPAFDDDEEVDEDKSSLPTTVFDVSIPPTPSNDAQGPLFHHRQRTERLSLSTQAQRILTRKKTKRWHAALAGAVAGGLGVGHVSSNPALFNGMSPILDPLGDQRETRDDCSATICQARRSGLQGSYNLFSDRYNFHIPHGDVLVFSLVCGQILYAFLLRPDSLPRSYTNWVATAAKVPHACLRMNYDMVRNHSVDFHDVDSIIARAEITPSNKALLLSLKDTFSKIQTLSPGEPSPYFPHYSTCAAIHPAQTSCWSVPTIRFFEVAKWMLPIYGALHFVPAVLFKRSTFMKNPLKVLMKAAIGTGRSSSFLGLFVIIYQGINCFKNQSHEYLSTLSSNSPLYPLVQKIPKSVIDSLISKYSFFVPGLFSGLALFIEEKRRRPELAMYVLPKGLESLWIVAMGKVGLKKWKNSETVLMAIGMAMVMSTYQNDPQHLSDLWPEAMLASKCLAAALLILPVSLLTITYLIAAFPKPPEGIAIYPGLSSLPRESKTWTLYPPDLYGEEGTYVNLPYGKTRYWLMGPPESDKKIVLIHGLSVPAMIWKEVAPSLAAKGYRVLLYDLYGRGYSDAPQTKYDSNLYVTQLALLMQHVKWDKAILVGVSMGGGVAAAFAASFPDLVEDRVIVISSAGLVLTSDMSRTTKFMSLPLVQALTSSFIAQKFLQHLIDSPNETTPVNPIEDIVRLQSAHLPGFNNAISSTLREGPVRGEYRSFSSDVWNSRRLLIIHGTTDNTVPYKYAKMIESALPRHCRSEIVTIDGGGHDLTISHPNFLVKEIERWIQLP